MFKNAKVIRLVPDQQGLGGSKTSLTTLSKNLDTYKASGVFVYLGRWRKAIQAVATGLTANSNTVGLVLHNFAKIDTTNALNPPTNFVLSHGYVAGSPNAHSVFDHSQNFVVKSANSTPDSFVPATFSTIRQRCFVCWAGSNNFIYDGTTGGSGVYDVGVTQPATAPAYTISGGPATAFVTNGGNKVTYVSGTAFTGGVTSLGIAGTVYTVQSFINSFATPGTITGTIGNFTATVNAAWPTVGDYNGLALTTGGHTYTVYNYTVAGAVTSIVFTTALLGSPAGAAYTLAGTQYALSSNYGGATAQAQSVNVPTGVLSWTTRGPAYAYAYYDPVTGHVSNMSPIIQTTEQNLTGVQVNLTAIIDSVAADRTRFTKILIFRTIVNGSTGLLYPLSSGGAFITLNNDGTGPHSYTDNNPDSALLVNGGLAGPLVTNKKPPPFAHQVYWGSRVFGIPVSDPSSVLFSADVVQAPFGVSEESYPAGNVLRIPAEDGGATGMRLMGDIAIITTRRYAYYIVGTDETNYALLRFSTTAQSVGDYQMTEFAGDTSENSSALTYFSLDKMFYMLAPAYGNVPLSVPIQDQLNAAIGNSFAQYAASRVFTIGVEGQKYIVLTIGSNVYVYDFNRKLWTQMQIEYFNGSTNVIVTPQAFAQQFGGSRPVDLLFLNAGTVYAWLRNDGARVISSAFVESPPYNFDKKARRQFNFIRLYVSDPAPGGGTWSVTTSDNETTGFTATAAVNADPLYQLQPVGALPIDSANAKELIVTAQQFGTGAGGGPLEAFRWLWSANFPSNNTPCDLYAVDFCYSDIDDPGEESL